MLRDEKVPHGRSGAVQTAGDGTVVGSQQCEACGAGLRGGQRVACSEKCRARDPVAPAAGAGPRDDELRVLALAVRLAAEALERRLKDPR
jgi:hypothetical protein